MKAQIERTKRYFDRRRPDGGRIAVRPMDEFIFRRVCAVMPQGSRDRLAVDLGCHWGRYTRILAETYGEVIGLDFAAQAIASAPVLPRVSYFVCDLERDALPVSRPVDLFVAVGLFEMLGSPDGLATKLAAYTARTGEVFVLVPNRRHIHFYFLRFSLWIARNFLGRRDLYIYHNGVSPERLERAFCVAGFRLEAGGEIVGLPPSIVGRFPAVLQASILSLDAAARAGWGGAYHWMRWRKA